MKDYTLNIKWNTGYMTLHCELFFPCSAEKMRFLIKKVIPLALYAHQEEVFQELHDYFIDRIQRTEAAVDETKKIHGENSKEHKRCLQVLKKLKSNQKILDERK